MDMILIAGLWLDSSVWGQTAAALRDYGHRPIPVALPGVEDRATTATLDDQVAAVLTAAEGARAEATSAAGLVVVGHSAASTLAWLLADRRPDLVARAVLVGGFPAADGTAYADFFPVAEGVMPFPGWEPFEGADIADLDESSRQRLAAGAIPVPEAVARGTVQYHDERRLDVPVTLVCPEYSPAQAQAWIAAGDVPELAAARHVSYLDIDSGHWPMVSQPAELARVLHAAAQGG